MPKKTKKGLLRGKKFNGNHQTIIPDALQFLQVLKGNSNISKIILGPIKKIKNGQIRLKTIPINAGFRLVVRGTIARQIFYIYTSLSYEEITKLLKIT